MAHNWNTSNRRKDPPGWRNLRAYVIQRDGGRCQANGCTRPGEDVDHIVNLANGGTDDPNNLTLLCRWHHKQKTAQEAAAARTPRTTSRGQKPHPGILHEKVGGETPSPHPAGGGEVL